MGTGKIYRKVMFCFVLNFLQWEVKSNLFHLCKTSPPIHPYKYKLSQKISMASFEYLYTVQKITQELVINRIHILKCLTQTLGNEGSTIKAKK